MRIFKRTLLALAALILVGVAWLTYGLNDRPSLEPYASHALASPSPGAGLRITLLGVSTVLVDDGRTAILTDGFFTRPGLLRMAFAKITPDIDAIESSLARAGIDELAAVLVVHSHYDHAMDAPEVARRTGAVVVGSESTANVARGLGLEEKRIKVIADTEVLAYGDFKVTMIRSRHFPHGMAMGEIETPLVPPARATAYLEGGSYSVLLEHPSGSLLIQGSAGFLEGALDGYRADTVLLGIGALGTRDQSYREDYWREVVRTVGARRVIPIHWDDFTLPLSEPLQPMPRLTDDFDKTMEFLLAAGPRDGVQVKMLREWIAADPFIELN